MGAIDALPSSEWIRCPGCSDLVYLRRLRRDLLVCSACQHHLPLSTRERLDVLVDPGSFVAFADNLAPVDFLDFVDTQSYADRLASAQSRTGRRDALVTGTATIEGVQVVLTLLDFSFLGGSMGSVVGEAFERAAREALTTRRPLVMVTASGGARMQEGATSLMQLAKTAQAIAVLRENGIPTINLNTNPTYGGATASFAMLGDVIVAEPGAMIGFAGKGVIANTIRQDLPDGFQTAEFLLAHGMIDFIAPRAAQRATIGRVLRCLRTGGGPRLALVSGEPGGRRGRGQQPTGGTRRDGDLGATDVVALARHVDRPTVLEHLAQLCDDLVVLAGDRCYADDPALVGGVGRIGDRGIVFLGHHKGHTTTELVAHNFGMPKPEGYRKAIRLMRLAERLGLPVVTVIDTPGAYPGIDAEERGQGTAIAEAIMTMSALRTPTVCIVTGEGGSGGALALGVADRVLMMANAYYSVISPEGCSTILFGSAASAGQAARALKLRATDLLDLGIVDEIVPEPAGGAHLDPYAAAHLVADRIAAALVALAGHDPEVLVERRRSRFSALGRFREVPSPVAGPSREESC